MTVEFFQTLPQLCSRLCSRLFCNTFHLTNLIPLILFNIDIILTGCQRLMQRNQSGEGQLRNALDHEKLRVLLGTSPKRLPAFKELSIEKNPNKIYLDVPNEYILFIPLRNLKEWIHGNGSNKKWLGKERPPS